MNIARVITPTTTEEFRAAAECAAELLRAGEAVVIPTETVYGLAANALDARAVQRIFEIKGRPSNNPVIVHIHDLEMARNCVSEWPEIAHRLSAAFWPGPLTMVLPRRPVIPDVVTAGGPTVAIRWPSHPFMLEVIRICGFPLAAPSANPSGRTSPTNAAHALRLLGDRVPLIVDGGQSQVGIESTVVDLTSGVVRVLRPGVISAASLRSVVPDARVDVATDLAPGNGPLLSPGQLSSHYSPRARLKVFEWRDDAHLERQVAALDVIPSKAHIVSHTHLPSPAVWGRVSVIPHDPEAFARALYAELHQCDEAGAELIVVEKLPEGPEWEGVADRLRRAAAGEPR